MDNPTDYLPALGVFLDPAALGIVIGGAVVATILRTPSRDLLRAIAALRVLIRPRFRATPLLNQVEALGRIARRHGTVALDRTVITDPDVAAAVAGIVDARPVSEIGDELVQLRRARIERHVAAADAWTGLGEVAPAMGMVGTLIGLVRMFSAMNDPAAIGGAMAIALLATLYGALLANLIAMPVANRLRRRAREEATERARLEAPLIALAEQERPEDSCDPRVEGGMTAFDEFPESASGRPIWLMTLADLALLLVGFFVFIQANGQLDRHQLAQGFRAGFGFERIVQPAEAPDPMPVAAAAMLDFAPGSAVLPQSPAGVIAWAREAARDPRVTLKVSGETDGSAVDVDGASGSAAVLANRPRTRARCAPCSSARRASWSLDHRQCSRWEWPWSPCGARDPRL